MAFTDGAGRTLNGARHSYTLTFPAGEIPQAKRFWSLTAYVPRTIELVPNRANKYLVASYTPGLVKNPDGSITITMAPTRPAGVPMANWLPVPRGEFSAVLRAYGPTGNTASPGYAPPAITPDALTARQAPEAIPVPGAPPSPLGSSPSRARPRAGLPLPSPRRPGQTVDPSPDSGARRWAWDWAIFDEGLVTAGSGLVASVADATRKATMKKTWRAARKLAAAPEPISNHPSSDHRERRKKEDRETKEEQRKKNKEQEEGERIMRMYLTRKKGLPVRWRGCGGRRPGGSWGWSRQRRRRPWPGGPGGAGSASAVAAPRSSICRWLPTPSSLWITDPG